MESRRFEPCLGRMKELGKTIANVLADMPVYFKIDKRRFCIYPPTLGKMYLISQLSESLGINKENLAINPFLEIMRAVESKRKECCKLLAYHILNKREDLFNIELIEQLSAKLDRICDDEDITTLLIVALKNNALEDIIKVAGIDKEQERMSKVSAAKDSKNQYVFGGKTVWGTMIDAACERYGWSFDYVVWEISYNNLTLMLKDKITSIYLSDEEAKRCRIPMQSGDYIDGNDKDAVMKAVMESELNPE